MHMKTFLRLDIDRVNDWIYLEINHIINPAKQSQNSN
jgi:hypothetical protein